MIKNKKSCELCNKKGSKLIRVRIEADLYIYICKECNRTEKELWENKKSKKAKTLNCYGIENKSKTGKITFLESNKIYADWDGHL